MPVGRAPAAVARARRCPLVDAGGAAGGPGAGGGGRGRGQTAVSDLPVGGLVVGSVMWLDASLAGSRVGSVPPPSGDPILAMDRAPDKPPVAWRWASAHQFVGQQVHQQAVDPASRRHPLVAAHDADGTEADLR